MYPGKKLSCYLLFAFLFCLINHSASGQISWKFEQADPLMDTADKVKLNWIGRMHSPELVQGVAGAGIRTDGYSTWLSAKLPYAYNKPCYIHGFFALETYPTDTAGFFTLFAAHNQDWVSACVDRFGTPMIGLSRNGKLTYYPATIKLLKFKWAHVCLNIQKTGVQLLVNGTVAVEAPFADTTFKTGIDSLMIGRDGRIKAIGIFPLTAINGIIDEVGLNSGVFIAGDTFKRYLNKLLKQQPDLAVPAVRFKDDFNRPAYHLLPAANWTNETHALIYYKGNYHIFNQKNGANLFLGQINWGHFVSPDLIHWTELRPALSPEPGYDQNGIWSGCTVMGNDGKPVIIYTGGGDNQFGMCLAYPIDAALKTWRKYVGNPVISAAPAMYTRKDFHDPYVWKAGKVWYMIVGFGLVEEKVEKGAVLLYRSEDLKKWTFLHPLFTGDPEKDNSGVFWEMPVFWKMNNKYILLVNKVPNKGKPAVALYWTGNFVNETFVPDYKIPQKLEVINRLLSPSVALDAAGQTTAIGIIPDETSSRAAYEQGWTHLYSIPRVWTLENGRINQQPHPVMKNLRTGDSVVRAMNVVPGKNILICSGKHQLEINADIVPGTAKRFGFVIGKSPSGDEFTRIYYDFEKHQLIVDQTRSSLRKFTPLRMRIGDYDLSPAEPVNIHLFIDGSVAEGFINNKDAFSTRFFPKFETSTGIEVFADGGEIRELKAEVWQLKSSNNKTDFK